MVAPIKDMKWMILGGESQLGQAMAMELARKNVEFISLNRTQLDITNQIQIDKWLNSKSPEVVINTAAWTNVDLAEFEEEGAFLVNAYGPKLLAAACSRIRAKFVHISTDYVFSGETSSPWKETAATSPRSAYGRTKMDGERFVLDTYPSNSFIVRTAWLYSPWGRNFVKTVLKIALHETKSLEVVNDQIGQPTSALDLASQIQQMINMDISPGIYHGTNSGQVSWFELAQQIFMLAGEDPCRVVAVDSKHFPRPAKRPAYSVLGHEQWVAQGLSPMRNWCDAVKDALPAIVQTINQGE